ncbi:MAG: hypothetical protein ACHQXL_09935, partial [Candidatus Limnocylindrales bacterium]
MGGSFLIVAATLAMTASLATAAATANLQPTTQVGQDEWRTTPPSGSPANALASSGDDNQYVSTDIANSDEGYGGFGIVVPAGSIINGITVRTGAFSTDASGCQLSVRLSWNAGANWTSYQTQNLTGTESTLTFGSATN